VNSLPKFIVFDRVNVVVTLFTLTFSLLFGQVPDTLWTRTFGGTGPDIAFLVQQTTDGGYIVVGHYYSRVTGDYDVYLIRTNANGDSLWTRTYGGHSEDIGWSVQQTSDGGYIVAGSTKSFGIGYRNVWLLKTDENGDTLWTRTYGWTNADNTGYSVQQTTDGGYIVAGWTRDHMLLIKTDANGDTLWLRTYGTTGFSGGFSVQQTSDGGYIIGGFYSYGNTEFFLVKTDSVGDTLWTKIYGGPLYDRIYSVKETSDGGYIAAGALNMLYGRYGPDVCLLRMDSNGDTLWMRTYGGSLSDVGYSVAQTHNGKYVVVGSTHPIDSDYDDVYFLKANEDGDTLWTTRLGGPRMDWGYSVQATTDGGYIIAGWTASWGAGDYDVYLIKTAPDTFGIEENNIQKPRSMYLGIAPNPFSKKTDIRFQTTDNNKVTMEIYDVSGRLVKNLSLHAVYSTVHYAISWDGRDNLGKKLPSGVYFLRFEAGGFKETEKLILLK